MTRVTRPVVLTILVWAMCIAFARSAGEKADVCDVTIAPVPANWELREAGACRALLYKRFEAYGYWYDQYLSVQASTETYEQLQTTLETLYRVNGFQLVDRARIGVSGISAPLWILYKTAADGESGWLAFLVHGGLTYSVQMRANSLDANALLEFGQVLSAMAFKSDDRAQAWAALENGDAARAVRNFERLVGRDSLDTNARYGLGLARLAQGDLGDAAAALERARPQLGVSEDVRRGLARVAYERGQFARAASLWIQVVRDNPGWDGELRAWILKAADRVPASARSVTGVDAIVSDAGKMLYLLQVIDQQVLRGGRSTPIGSDGVDMVRQDLQTRLTQTLNAMARDGGSPGDARVLLAALDVERGLATASQALKSDDEEAIYRAELTIGAAMRAMGATATP
jgi:tetratricopeptide (TPR) repeat protein